MGDDPRTASSTKDGRSWSIPNLWVCDGSLFPTSGGVNPSLTIQALACRIGSRISAMAETRRAVKKRRPHRQHRGPAQAGARARAQAVHGLYGGGLVRSRSRLRENRRDLDSIRFRERVMFDVSDRKLEPPCSARMSRCRSRSAPPECAARSGRTARSFLPRGARVRHSVFAFDQRLAVDRGCRSSVDRPFWFQLYLEKDRGFSKDLLERAKKAGCPVLILTMDLHVEAPAIATCTTASASAQAHAGEHLEHRLATRTGRSRCSIRSAGASAIMRTR